MMKEEKEDLVNVTGGEGGVYAPQGFAASSVIAGIEVSGNPGMALIVNQGPEKTAAAVFTTNRVQVVPVTVSKEHIADGKLSAMVLNSGNANACNGQPGTADALKVCQEVADELGVDVTRVGTYSIGLIGDRLPMDIVLVGASKLCENLDSDAATGTTVAEAVLTTDLVAKRAVAHSDGLTVDTMDKGVSMISPLIATMLGMITTDASISAEMAHEAITKASKVTSNRLDINGSASTSDAVIILANGASGVKPSRGGPDQTMLSVCNSIAHQMQSDVEDMAKRMSMTVRGAGGMEDTLVAVQIIDHDNLFKCAMPDSDPSWGCVLAAVGTASVDMDPEHITVSFNDHVVCRDTDGTPDAREVDLSSRDIAVEAGLGTSNPEEATTRTTDLSHDYAHINSAYSP